jgi:predicted TIM-barrel fold metal-dependent hydrolase
MALGMTTQSANHNKVVDVHAHIGRTVAMNMTQSADEYIDTMRATNIVHAILSPMAGGRQADGIRDTRRENDAVAEAMRTDPVRFPMGLASVEVRHEEYALLELERCLTTLGLHGLVVHAMFSGFSIGLNGALAPLLEYANERSALCLMHAMPDTGPFAMESPRAIGELAGRYTGVTFVMGHAAITEDQRAISIEAALGRPNVYVDLAYQEDPVTVETFVRALGAERVLFGSDCPFRDPAVTIRSVEQARISVDAKERILYANAAMLLSRYTGVTFD